MRGQAGPARARTRDTLLRSRACVAILAAVLLLPAGQASTEMTPLGGCDAASGGGGGGIAPATASLRGAPFNEVFGLNAMAKGDAASPSPFR